MEGYLSTYIGEDMSAHEQFQRISEILTGDLRLDLLNAEPARPRQGEIKLADGTNWDPVGVGVPAIVWYNGSAWELLNIHSELAVTTVTTTPYTALGSDKVILVDDDTIGGAATIDLPAASNRKAEYVIKKLGSTGNVTIDANGGDLIDGGATAVLTTQYESLTIVSDLSDWWII